MKQYVLFTLLGGLLAVSCKKDTTSVDLHYDYFGLNQGRYVIYDVVDITHASSTQHDTAYYQLKTLIGDTITDNEGRTAYKFMRYTRPTSSDPWVLSDTWMAIIAGHKAELIEENQRIIKLVFAPATDKFWNANAYNTYDELNCYYEEIHNPYTVNSQVFDSTVTVEQDDELNLIEYRRKYEVYANEIGMIKKHYRDLKINNFDITDITQGQELFMEVVSFGVE